MNLKERFEDLELPAKLLDYFLRSNKSNINHWFDRKFVIRHFLNYCLVHIVSLWPLSIGVRIIFTTNELVDGIKNFKSNASLNDKDQVIVWKNMRRRPDFLWTKMRRRQDLSNQMHRRPDCLTKSSWEVCPIDKYVIHFAQITVQNLLLLINPLINGPIID